MDSLRRNLAEYCWTRISFLGKDKRQKAESCCSQTVSQFTGHETWPLIPGAACGSETAAGVEDTPCSVRAHLTWQIRLPISTLSASAWPLRKKSGAGPMAR